jgi:hypothetical protein
MTTPFSTKITEATISAPIHIEIYTTYSALLELSLFHCFDSLDVS